MTQPIEDMWDACRDGDLTPQESDAFARHLRDSDADARLWHTESGWLNALAHDTVEGGEAFTAAVVERWSAEATDGVAGRIGWRSVGLSIGWAASIAALIALGVWLGNLPASQPPIGPAQPGPVATIPPGPRIDTSDTVNPVSALLDNVHARVAEQPARIRQAVEQTASLLDVNRMFSLLDVPLPDPAQYVDPPKKS
jgi:hypothetical protein